LPPEVQIAPGRMARCILAEQSTLATPAAPVAAT
jgi:hypothetical protein